MPDVKPKEKAHTPSEPVQLVRVFTLAALSLYTFGVSIFVILQNSIFLWPFILFAVMAAFSLYALYKIVKGNDSTFLVWTIIVHTLLATLLLYPATLGIAGTLFGLPCRSISECSQDTLFTHKAQLIIFVPMLVLAIFAYAKTKQKTL